MKRSLTKKAFSQILAKFQQLPGIAPAALFSLILIGASPEAKALEVNKGDHVVLLGNALAERMQHHGWLETYAQLAMPDKELVFRNHGFCGDKVDKRPRNRGFINPHDYLTISKADVILTFFGANEAWDKNPGAYKGTLSKWIDETKGKQYNGKSAPRIVLFSPIAHEDLGNPNLPDGKEQNKHLAAYATATAEVAKEKGVEYVDLFGASQQLYAKSGENLTMNGIHLTDDGNRQIAEVILKTLFGKDAPTNHKHLKQTKEAVLKKNWHWFNRYRATDGNDVWGGRSGLRFVDNQSNKDALFHELTMIDVMTANRDKVVHAAAKGKTIVADDSNVPPPVAVKSNIGGKSRSSNAGKEGTAQYKTPKETLEQLELAEGLEANVFASEEMFPEAINPVQLGVGPKGRLWVASWRTYPKWEPLKEMGDTISILPDENRDGVADKSIVFAKVHNPTGFTFWNGGVIVASAPDLIFLKDTDGDDKADVRIRIMHGIDSADTHHAANNLTFGPGGYVYYQRGVFHVSNVETPWKGPQQHGNSAMYRFNPRTFEYSFHANNSPNPHGVSFNHWGYHFATDGTGGRAYQVRPDGKGGFKMQSLLKKTVRPVPSSGILSSDHFPERNNGNFLICNSIGFLGIKQYTLATDENGNVQGTQIEDLLVSKKDRNFRPTDFEIGDDGALYVADWQNVIIGHMQHNVRDPNRDKNHGRIFRIKVKDRPLMKHVKVVGQPLPVVLDLLKHNTYNIRLRARFELSSRDTDEVIKATKDWLKKNKDPNAQLEGLWVHQQHNVVNKELLQSLLNSKESNARVAAKTVEQFWRDRL
ncbi:MAG: hypothetical protein CMI30_10015 [Opitutae bacterium]|nr:hypothetical protein [Opitutae bacterium]|tara:strand:- start:1659 stop:4109 length:2451 start_codon:yes stop_codon:yes gene_type:complete